MAARRNGPGASKDGEESAPGSWADELDGVRRLPERDGRPEKGPGKRAERTEPARPRATAPARFHHPDPDDPGLGFASGISNAQRRQLQQGRIRPDRRIDLHGLTRDEARRACISELRAAAEEGDRCVLVVHGKGARSADGPVLRPALPGWLADPALEGRVLAFAPARPDDGGRGASYVLLRRRRDAD